MNKHNGNAMNILFKFFLIAMLALFAGTASAVEKVTYYHNDALGSPVAATDAQGSLLWEEAYEPYGKRLLKEDGGKEDVWFTGKQEESDFDVSYFGARWYDPAIGRFLAIDPAGVSPSNIHSFNRYTYANNNPHRFVDPDGKNAVLAACAGGPAACAIGAGITIYVAAKAILGTQKALNESSDNSEGGESTWDGDYGSEVNWLPGDYFPTPDGGGGDNDPNKEDPKRQKSKKSEHDSKKQKSKENKHQEGKARTKKDAGNESGDIRRKLTNKGGPGGSRKRH